MLEASMAALSVVAEPAMIALAIAVLLLFCVGPFSKRNGDPRALAKAAQSQTIRRRAMRQPFSNDARPSATLAAIRVWLARQRQRKVRPEHSSRLGAGETGLVPGRQWSLVTAQVAQSLERTERVIVSHRDARRQVDAADYALRQLRDELGDLVKMPAVVPHLVATSPTVGQVVVISGFSGKSTPTEAVAA